ncbi:MAG: hypothetical protein ACFE0Q_13990 [Anaerolineae bacterium]
MMIVIAPQDFDASLHHLPTAGELLLAGDQVTIDADGVAFKRSGQQVADGFVIEVCRKGEQVEIATLGEQQEDGGFYFEQICVMTS